MPKTKTVFVGLSGGVDSSVAAYLLQKNGYHVVGVFMRSYNVDGCAERDAEDARRVATKLRIPFYVWDFEDEYKKKVVKYMVEGYRKGITPNPDVMCNREMKFGLFLKRALEMGADYVATGHYVRLGSSGNVFTRRSLRPASSLTDAPPLLVSSRHRARSVEESRFKNIPATSLSLFEAVDKNKDQSYFLWTLTQEQLKYCLFPIGEYVKPEVRAIAKKAGLPTAEKKDSQGVCFLGKVTLSDFLKNYISTKKGAVVDTSGNIIGEHDGAYFYTIGERHGNLRYNAKSARADMLPRYIAEKNVKTNTVVVVEGDTHEALYRTEVQLTDVNFVNKELGIRNKAQEIPVLVRVRYRQPLAKALFIIRDSLFHLVFDVPQKFVAPGQSAVFYLKTGEVLGGGVIL